MQAGKPIAQRQGVRIGERGPGGARLGKQRLALNVPALCGIDRDGDVVADLGAVGVVPVGMTLLRPSLAPRRKMKSSFLTRPLASGCPRPPSASAFWTKSGTSVNALRAAVAASPVVVLKKFRRVRMWGVFMARCRCLGVCGGWPDLIVPESGVNLAAGRPDPGHARHTPWFPGLGSKS